MKKLIVHIFLVLCTPLGVFGAPILNFSDIDSGPKTGNTDGVGSGAIVTIWGNNLGSTQGTSKVYVGNVEATAIYYWKDADGTLPGGPADLKTYHKMQEIAFAVPSGAADGANTIKVTVGGTDSNTLPFTVRTGNIYYIKSTGHDTTGNGSWNSPWLTLQSSFAGPTGVKLLAGDIVYSVGVGTTDALQVGNSGALIGTVTNPISLIAYPNSTFTISNSSNQSVVAAVRNYNTGTLSSYINFSKFYVNTIKDGFGGFRGMRCIGINGTAPTFTTGGSSGFVGGSVVNGSSIHMSDIKMYGLEIHDYGAIGNTDTQQHLFYLSNRSGSIIPGYEIAWGYFHDNPIYQGLHIYDQGAPCGDWSTPIKLHHNVIKNQRGNAINLNANCTPNLTVQFEIHDNLLITDTNYTTAAAAFRFEIAGSSSKVYNNTSYGYNASSAFSSGTVDFRNNIMVDTQSVAFTNYTPTTHSNNLFYSTGSTAQPTWATSESGHVSGDPLFNNATNYDFSLNAGSPALSAGYNTTLVAPTDLLGNTRTPNPSIGAFDIALTVTNGTCGSSNNQSLSSAPTSGLCSAGTASSVTGTGPWSWTCVGSSGGTTASCSASLAVTTSGYKWTATGLVSCAGCQ